MRQHDLECGGAVRCEAVRCVALHCVALRCAALHCVALRCAALRCAALRCTLYHLQNSLIFLGLNLKHLSVLPAHHLIRTIHPSLSLIIVVSDGFSDWQAFDD